MKQPKKLTRIQKEFLASKTRYKPDNWLFLKTDSNGNPVFCNKTSGSVMCLDSVTGKAIHTNKEF